MADTEDELQSRIEKMVAFVEAADSAVQQDELKDLGDLDNDITALCNDVEQADPEIAAGLQPDMAILIARLDTLARHIKAFQTRQEQDNEEQDNKYS